MKKLFIFILLGLQISFAWVPDIWTHFLENPSQSPLYDFSFAGYHAGKMAIPIYQKITMANEFGVIADDGKDDAEAVNRAIESAAKSGGGIVQLPAGRLDLNVSGNPNDPQSQTFILITNSKIILKGNDPKKGATILYQNKSWVSPNQKEAYKHHSCIEIGSMDSPTGTIGFPILSLSKRNQSQISVKHDGKFKVGDMVFLRLHNPTNQEGKRLDTLSRELTQPLQPEEDWIYFSRYTVVTWPTRLLAIQGDLLTLAEPLPYDMDPKFQANVSTVAPYPEDVGIEDLYFDTAWDKDYGHHRDQEHDYGYSAISVKWAVNCWIQRISISNMLNDIKLPSAKWSTVREIVVGGKNGHHGMKTTGWNNLFEDIVYETERTHVAGLDGAAIGNVFRQFKLSEPCPIDSHGGGLGMQNLFEKFIGGVSIGGGGAAQNMPHSGPWNIFWNCEFKPLKTIQNELKMEFFPYSYWNYNENIRKRGGLRFDNHLMYPRSILIGVWNYAGTLQVNQDASDRNNNEITIQGLGKSNVEPASLYQAMQQLKEK